MGYTIGRRHTKESLREIALQFKTRSEFQINDPAAYNTAKRRNIIEEICSHMVIGKYSTPQLICKKIMEKVIGQKCIYNGRKAIEPYELDIYFPELKLAIEYNGKGWHKKKSVIERDEIKKELCKEKGILLIVVVENSRQYEEDVKNQLIKFLPEINGWCKLDIKKEEIEEIGVEDVYESLLNEDRIKELIKECKNIADFQRKHSKEYEKIRRANRLDLLEPIRQVVLHGSDEDVIERLLKIDNYSDFVADSSLYQVTRKRGLIKHTSHMRKDKKSWSDKSDEFLIEEAKKYKTKIDLKNNNDGLRGALTRRGLYEEATKHMTPLTNRIY